MCCKWVPVDKDCKPVADHYEPKPTEIVLKYRFYNCKQNNQTIPQFVADLQELSEGCKVKEFKDNLLRNTLTEARPCSLNTAHNCQQSGSSMASSSKSLKEKGNMQLI